MKPPNTEHTVLKFVMARTGILWHSEDLLVWQSGSEEAVPIDQAAGKGKTEEMLRGS